MFHAEFFPTPADVAAKMISGIRIPRNAKVIDPSAGKGDLLDAVLQRMGPFGADQQKKDALSQLFAIEPVTELRAILMNKGYSLIDHDFLAHANERQYYLVVMNPPFSDGHKHLRKALEIAPYAEIRCLLNAETINNPHAKERQLLMAELEARGAEFESMGQAFTQAERRTGVEVVMVKVPGAKQNLNQFQFNFTPTGQEKLHSVNQINMGAQIETRDVIKSLVGRYEQVKRCAAELKAKLDEMKFYATGLIDVTYMEDFMAKAAQKDYESFVSELRGKAWDAVYAQTPAANYFTRNVRSQVDMAREQHGAVAFTEGNIYDLIAQFMMAEGALRSQCIQDAFDLMTKYHKENRQHIEGWKSNESWRVTRKVVLPNIVSNWFGYSVRNDAEQTIADIERALCMVEGVEFQEVRSTLLCDIFSQKALGPNGTWQDSRFFEWKWFMKGTIHLKFKDESIWKRFNADACQGSNWIGGGFDAA